MGSFTMVRGARGVDRGSAGHVQGPKDNSTNSIQTVRDVPSRSGCALSPLLFILVMDYISKQVGGDRSTKLRYADYVALQTDNEQELQRLVAGWSAALKAHGMKLSIDKTVVLAASVGDQKKLKVMLEGKQLEQVSSFKTWETWWKKEGP